MKFYRIPTKQEEQLIELLVHKSSLEMSEDWKNGLLVRPMDDGEMGSLYLFPQGKINESRKLGRQISEFQFTDIDGVEAVSYTHLLTLVPIRNRLLMKIPKVQLILTVDLYLRPIWMIRGCLYPRIFFTN